MRAILVTVATVGAAAVMGGCGGQASAARALPESDYFASVRDSVPSLADADESTLRRMGRWVVCDSLVAGDTNSWLHTLAVLTKGGIPARQAGGLILYSTATYCPAKATALPS